MRAGGPSLNPNGRPKVGQSMAERVRALVDPDELIEFFTSVLRDTTCNMRERLQSAESLASRGWGRPESNINMNVNRNEGLPYPSGWDSLPPSERVSWVLGQRQLALRSGK